MPTIPKSWVIAAAALLLTHAAAFYAGYQYKGREFTPVVEGPRAGADLPGGGVLLPRVPDGEPAIEQPDAPTPGATHIRGSEITIGGLKPERVDRDNTSAGHVQKKPKIELDVTDREEGGSARSSGGRLIPSGKIPREGNPAPGSKPECLTADDFVCPQVKVRFDLWEHEDNTWGVTAVTDKGEVVGGMDLPDRQPMRFTPKVWGAGVEYEAPTGDVALVLQRDLGPFRVGGSVEVKSDDPEVRLQGVLRF